MKLEEIIQNEISVQVVFRTKTSRLSLFGKLFQDKECESLFWVEIPDTGNNFTFKRENVKRIWGDTDYTKVIEVEEV